MKRIETTDKETSHVKTIFSFKLILCRKMPAINNSLINRFTRFNYKILNNNQINVILKLIKKMPQKVFKKC